MKEMRRKSRQMDEVFAWQVFDQSDYQILSNITEENKPYAIPLSCARIGETIYFHCAKEGQKTDNIAFKNEVCLTAVGDTHIPDGKFTIEYESCLIFGKAYIVDSEDEKLEALRAICKRYCPDNMDNFGSEIKRSMAVTGIVKIEAERITGKRKKYGKDGKELKYGRLE